jgi:hypothetical protein
MNADAIFVADRMKIKRTLDENLDHNRSTSRNSDAQNSLFCRHRRPIRRTAVDSFDVYDDPAQKKCKKWTKQLATALVHALYASV